MVWKNDDPQYYESTKIRWETVPYTRGRGLDVGCGADKIWPHAIGVDNRIDTALFDVVMNPDITLNATDMSFFATCSFDWVFSSHMLEHCENYAEVAKEMFRIVKDGGYFMLYLPDEDEYPKIGEDGANPDHKWNVNYDLVVAAMEKAGGWDLIDFQKRNKTNEYSLWFVFRKLSDKKIHKYAWKDPKPEKTCAVVRYGAWGDGIQSTSILPGLKEQGYHITFYTTPRCFDVIQHEPLIDRIILQDSDQVPNAWLGDFWKYTEAKYDKFVNLSESVEATFLAMPDRMTYHWTTEARHMVMNKNYWEFMHAVAGVPYEKPLSRFVATEAEKKWAIEEKAKHAGQPTVMVALAGSSMHKVYEGIDTIIARLLACFRDVKVFTVGDERCKKLLENVWTEQPKVVCRSGVWSIRQTMAFAQVCDLVIGPETGVMSGVATADMPKIVLLSHSSVENLTRDWTNTFSLFSTKTKCAPCHKLIYNWEQCVKDEETGTAQCMADIPADAVWEAVLRAFDIDIPEPKAKVIPIAQVAEAA